jgi:ethanolamine utilization protein EutN
VQIGRVRGTVVATLKHPALRAAKLLLVEPCDPRGRPSGRMLAAVDVVDAGVGDWVVYLDEGASASQILHDPRGPVRTVIVGVLDDIRVEAPQSHP